MSIAWAAVMLLLDGSCPDVLDGSRLHVDRPPPSHWSPRRAAMPPTAVRVLCQIESGGRLGACKVDDEDPRGWGFGTWVRGEVSRWRLAAAPAHECAVEGRKVVFTVRSW